MNMAACCVPVYKAVCCVLLVLQCVRSTFQHPAVRDKRSARLYTGRGGYVATTLGPRGAGQVDNPNSGGEFNSQQMQLWYLNQYGYINDNSKQEISNIISHGGSASSALNNAIREFQAMMSIPQTGVMDAQTKQTMASPRCGNRDKLTTGKRRRKRYDHFGAPWRTTVITWKIKEYSRQMDYQTQTQIITMAFKQWSDVTPLRFVEDQSQSTANIEIKWVRRDHHDGYPFDGPAGVLAHAFFLHDGSYFTRIHFDEDENWTESVPKLGINLLWVVRHEIGHAIGLAHSDNDLATMRATYYPFDFLRNILGNDDIKGIQARYGVRRSDHFCSVGKMGAILTIRTETYIILNSFMLTARSNQINPTILAVTEVFGKNMNNVVDAIFHHGIFVYVFQGDTLYVYNENFIYQTEKTLSEVMPFGINHVSAAFVHHQRTYIIEDNTVYEVEPFASRGHFFSLHGTNDLTAAWGVPSSCRITAATTWLNGIVYFFCEDYYYIYPSQQQDGSYPRSTAQYWWGCGSVGSLGATGSPITRHNRILEVAEARAVASASEASIYSIHPALVVLFILQSVYQSVL